MSIERKSLISNRIASKKAIVTKPEGSKVASTKTVSHRVASVAKVANRLQIGPTKLVLNPSRVAMPTTKVRID